jgi:hypothetical protein
MPSGIGSTKYVRWDDLKKDDFITGIDTILIHKLEDNLDNLLLNFTDVPKDSIDEIVSQVNAIMLNSAEKAGMVRIKRNNQAVYSRQKGKNKPWFNTQCRQKRKQFSKARKRASLHKNNAILNAEKRKLAKEYKTCVRKQYRQYRTDVAHSLRNLHSKNPKKYWNILNRDKEKNYTKTPSCDEFYEMFKGMCENGGEDNNNNNLNNQEEENEILNELITVSEVLNCIKRLKNNKACGMDNILNEFLKTSHGVMINIFVKLFNLVLLTGAVPSDWTVGVIKPIYKKKGAQNDPNNYRGITILSCLGKLFTSIINDRLKKYIDTFGILGEEQAGFRNGFSTLDHIFTLYGIIDILLYKRKRLYCSFLDYEKAFDKVNRAFLWQKLLSFGVNGKVLKVITNMYLNAKSCVMINNDLKCSDFFRTNLGVRQGENLSPVLFALFLNDMKDFLAQNMDGLETLSSEARLVNMQTDEIDKMLNLFVLLYADDTVIFAETVNGLQNGLRLMKNYCDKWKLVLNVKKCKVIIFSRGKVRNRPDFFIGDEKLEIVDSFSYLGIKFNYNNKMHVAQRDLYDRASRAMFSLLKKASDCMLPVDLIIDLFDKTVLPILTYSCEIWGHDVTDIVVKLQLKFYKYVFNIRQSTPTMMIYGETGKFPVTVHVKCRMLCFWYKLRSEQSRNKLSYLIYKCLFHLYTAEKHRNAYLASIETIFNELGLSGFWTGQDALNVNFDWFKEKVKRCLQDQFMQQWYSHVDTNEIFFNYRMFKNVFEQEKYLSLLPRNCALSLLQFRTTNNFLPVNRLRYSGIPRIERICSKCNNNEIGDEFHYLFVCPFFDDVRKRCLPKIYYTRPNAYKFHTLFSSNHKGTLLKIKHFVCTIDASLR